MRAVCAPDGSVLRPQAGRAGQGTAASERLQPIFCGLEQPCFSAAAVIWSGCRRWPRLQRAECKSSWRACWAQGAAGAWWGDHMTSQLVRSLTPVSWSLAQVRQMGQHNMQASFLAVVIQSLAARVRCSLTHRQLKPAPQALLGWHLFKKAPRHQPASMKKHASQTTKLLAAGPNRGTPWRCCLCSQRRSCAVPDLPQCLSGQDQAPVTRCLQPRPAAQVLQPGWVASCCAGARLFVLPRGLAVR